jgi:hypothetical protein
MARPSDKQAARELERLSKLLFGSALRLPVASVIARARTDAVSVGQVVERLDLPAARYSAARAELEKFADAGLLVRVTRPRKQRVQEYRRLDGQYWRAAKAVADEFGRGVGR